MVCLEHLYVDMVQFLMCSMRLADNDLGRPIIVTEEEPPPLAEELFPFSAIRGDANVLIFPTLTSGNITYKLLRDLGGATAVGPMLVLHLLVDVRDAMGANAINTMAESLAPEIEHLCRGRGQGVAFAGLRGLVRPTFR